MFYVTTVKFNVSVSVLFIYISQLSLRSTANTESSQSQQVQVMYPFMNQSEQDCAWSVPPGVHCESTSDQRLVNMSTLLLEFRLTITL